MDFNFFEPVRKKKKKNILGILIINIFVLILGITLIFLGLSIYEYNKLKEQVEEYNRIMGGEAYAESLEKAIEAEAELKELIASIANLAALDVELNMKHSVNTVTVGTLSQQVPVNLSLENIAIEKDAITIAGVATDLMTIAQFQQYLDNCGLFDSPWISGISQGVETYLVGGEAVDEYDVYSFSLTMMIKAPEVDVDEDAQESEDVEHISAE